MIAILGANSHIARDVVPLLDFDIKLFSRGGYDEFGKDSYDAIINFIGVGDPAKKISMGSEIVEITEKYDNLVMNYLQSNTECKYIFISSGIVHKHIMPSDDWYGIAKLYAEYRHREKPELSIVDLRIFNYFSKAADLSARFMITDILRAIINNSELETSPKDILRDYLHPIDLAKIISIVLENGKMNCAIDCYSKESISKFDLMYEMASVFGLKYKICGDENGEDYVPLTRNIYGYFPEYTSKRCVVEESKKILGDTQWSGR